MKRFLKVISICLLTIIFVETIGFNKINHCCGNSEVFLALSEIGTLYSSDLNSNSPVKDYFEELLEKCQHEHDGCATEVANLSAYEIDLCQDHTASGFHCHHHDAYCLNIDLLQLRPLQREKSLFSLLCIFMPPIIRVFDFKPQPVEVSLPDQLCSLTPQEAGRHKLALFSVFLI